jgi:sortase A
MTYVRILGKLLISIGFGILLFVAWTLWGTGLLEQRAQNDLSERFDDAPPVVVADDPIEPGYIRVPESYQPSPGDPVFKLTIPRIDLNKTVVEGVGVEDLRAGPGHYPECRRGFEKPLCTEFEEIWPGEKGRLVVSGHRTTYGAPFWDLDKLRPGDEIITKTKWGDFTYVVTETAIVNPDSRTIVIDRGDAELVLTTCNPKFSASQRLIVFADLQLEEL